MCCVSQLTIDVPWSPACIDKRCYDYVSLADIADFIFVMSYDERSQVFGPCVAWANSALNTTLSGASLCLSVTVLSRGLTVSLHWKLRKIGCKHCLNKIIHVYFLCNIMVVRNMYTSSS